MPFVTDIAGPQRPVQTWPSLAAGTVRRTSSIDTHPAGTGRSDVDLRARDAVGVSSGGVDVLGSVRVRAHLADRVIDEIVADPHDARLPQLLGSRVGPGFRSAVGKLLPDEIARASLVNLLLDDWVGAAVRPGECPRGPAAERSVRAPTGSCRCAWRRARARRPRRSPRRYLPCGRRCLRAASPRYRP